MRRHPELSTMLKFTEDCLNKTLSKASKTIPDKVAPKAYRNKMQGYKLWKEGCVSRVRVQPGITAGLVTLCLAKASVSASTERGTLAVFLSSVYFQFVANQLFAVPFPFLFMLQL